MSFGSHWYTGAQTQSAALKATETSIKQQELLINELKKEQEDHDKLHAAMMEAEKDLLSYAKRNKIAVTPTRSRKGLRGETTEPARYVSGDATPEFGRRLAEYQQKFQSHEGSNKRLAVLEDQVLNERKQASKVLKKSRQITEKQAEAEKQRAEAEASKQKAEADKAKAEAKRIRRETPSAFEAFRAARVRKAQQQAEQVEAQRQAAASRQALGEIREQEKREKELRKEQARLDRERKRQARREVRVKKHEKRVRTRKQRQKRSRPRRSGWRL